MAKLTIQTLPAEVLRKIAQPLPAVDKNVAAFMEDLVEAMYRGNGIGLAANQVGSLNRVIAIDVSAERNGKNALMMANPEIIWTDPAELFVYNEGCLSIPGQYADVKRPKRVRVHYIDQHGKKCELEAEDLLSQCIQHEIDHLNGALFIDRISKLKRDMILRKLEKERRDAEAEPEKV
jgi:peptide deformylase